MGDIPIHIKFREKMMPYRTIGTMLSLLSAGLIAACAGDPSIDREATVELAPMEKPVAEESSIRFMDRGELVVYEYAPTDDGRVAFAIVEGADAGCSYVNDGWFAPSYNWEDCGGRSGSQTFTKTGDIWPLQVGSSESYEGDGKAGNNQWSFRRRCETEDAVTVTIGDRALPAYEVVCTDNWSTRRWYVSPELGLPIKYRRVHNRRGVDSDMVIVRE